MADGRSKEVAASVVLNPCMKRLCEYGSIPPTGVKFTRFDHHYKIDMRYSGHEQERVHIRGSHGSVILVMLFSFLTSEEGYSVREDVVAGDYIEYEFYAEQHIAYDMEMNVNEFYDRFLHYDVSQMTQGEDALYPYNGSDLECRTFHSDDVLVYLAKGSDVPVYEEEDYYSLHYVRSLVSTTLDITKPVSPSDITDGTELKRVDVQTGGDANTTERMMTVGKIDEQGNTAVALKMLVLMEETVDLTVVSVDGDMLTMENGDEYYKAVSCPMFPKHTSCRT